MNSSYSELLMSRLIFMSSNHNVENSSIHNDKKIVLECVAYFNDFFFCIFLFFFYCLQLMCLIAIEIGFSVARIDTYLEHTVNLCNSISLLFYHSSSLSLSKHSLHSICAHCFFSLWFCFVRGFWLFGFQSTCARCDETHVNI